VNQWFGAAALTISDGPGLVNTALPGFSINLVKG
jgi:hypothetical protein